VTLNNEGLLDAVNWKLLEALQENARLSFKELGQRVGLTSPAVTERVRRLEEAGIITGYNAEISAAKIGLSVRAFIRLSALKMKAPIIGDFLKEIPEVFECYRVTGVDTYIIMLCASSVEHLEEVIDHIAQYGEPTTSIVLATQLTRRVIKGVA